MSLRNLPSNPNLDHLKYQAKDLLKAHAARDSRSNLIRNLDTCAFHGDVNDPARCRVKR